MEYIEIIIGVAWLAGGAFAIWLVSEGIDKYEAYKKRKHEAEQLAERVRNQVSCETCKCLMNKEEAYEVIQRREVGNLYYCQSCKPAYGLKKDNKFYKVLEVTEQGEPVGYIKKK